MNRRIFIAAEVIGEQDKTFTVRILNGFGNPEEIVHRDYAIEPATGGVIDAPATSGCCGGCI